MGQITFQSNQGGQVNLIGPSTTSTYNINVPATTGNMVTTGDSATVTTGMLASTTGSGAVVLATSPTLVTPALGTPSALVGTNITGTASGLSIGGNAATATSATTATNVSGGTASVTTLTASSTTTLSGGTANGVAYLNGSKVVTTGSALQFDGTNFLVGTATVLGGSIPGVNINGSGAGLTIGQSGTSKGYYFYNTASTRMQIESVSGTTIACVSGGTNGVSLANGGTSWGSLSDEKLKTAITPFEDATQKINSLRAGTGRYLTDEESVSRSFLIAQDVQKVLPEAVTEDASGNLVLQYTDIIPLLTAAIQEQQALIESLTTRLAALEAK